MMKKRNRKTIVRGLVAVFVIRLGVKRRKQK